jgi:hypothetical protein
VSGIQSVETRIAELMRLRRKIDEELARLVGMKPPRTRRSKFEIPECGTESAYQRHRYNGEEIDEACRLAHNEHERVQAALRRERARSARIAAAYGAAS